MDRKTRLSRISSLDRKTSPSRLTSITNTTTHTRLSRLTRMGRLAKARLRGSGVLRAGGIISHMIRGKVLIAVRGSLSFDARDPLLDIHLEELGMALSN